MTAYCCTMRAIRCLLHTDSRQWKWQPGAPHGKHGVRVPEAGKLAMIHQYCVRVMCEGSADTVPAICQSSFRI